MPPHLKEPTRVAPGRPLNENSLDRWCDASPPCSHCSVRRVYLGCWKDAASRASRVEPSREPEPPLRQTPGSRRHGNHDSRAMAPEVRCAVPSHDGALQPLAMSCGTKRGGPCSVAYHCLRVLGIETSRLRTARECRCGRSRTASSAAQFSALSSRRWPRSSP